MERRDEDVDYLVRIGVVVPIHAREIARGVDGPRRIREHVASPGQRRRIGGVLLVTSLDEHHPHIEREGSDEQEQQQAASEQDQDLSALIGAASC